MTDSPQPMNMDTDMRSDGGSRSPRTRGDPWERPGRMSWGEFALRFAMVLSGLGTCVAFLAGMFLLFGGEIVRGILCIVIGVPYQSAMFLVFRDVARRYGRGIA